MAAGLPSSIIGSYFNGMTEILEAERFSAQFAITFLRSDYSFNILRLLAELDGLHHEICIILKDFEPRGF